MPFLKYIEMRQISLLLGAVSILLLSACDKNGGASGEKGLDKVTYTVTDEQFPNPERGMYSGTSFSSESGNPISKNALLSGRAENRTLYMLEFWLKGSDSKESGGVPLRRCQVHPPFRLF